MIQGTSWSRDPRIWAQDYPICFVATRQKIVNTIHSINGNRTFWQTQDMLNPLYDPQAYREYPLDADEEFVESTLALLSTVLVEIRVGRLESAKLEHIKRLAAKHDIPITAFDVK